ncbi:MAG: VOC family protein [Oscillospiraceae bacterium]|nr:VOC family protein [Oscillospiraceae bacterium]
MLIPTIHFAGNCDEVIAFYKDAVGANVKAVHYVEDVASNFVGHSEVEIFGCTVALSDGCEQAPASENHTFTVFLDTTEQVTDIFNTLADGGTVTEPLAQQFWADLCGHVTDRFGVNWHICTKSMPQ